MSNYTKSTNFATKDSLVSGDPLKVIKGTEIDDEFEALETHIATKADLTDAAQNITMATALVTSINFNQNTSGWKVTQTGTDLIFSYSGVSKGKLDTDGNFTVIGDVIAGGTL